MLSLSSASYNCGISMDEPKSISPVLLLLLSLPTVRGRRRQERRYHYQQRDMGGRRQERRWTDTTVTGDLLLSASLTGIIGSWLGATHRLATAA